MKAALPAALLLLALAPALSACGGNDPIFGAKVRAYLLEHPEVLEEAMVRLDQKRAAEAAKQASAAIGTYRAALERDPRDFVANPEGKITVTEFFDYRCGYCKGAAPEVLKLIASNPDVRFVFKELPIFGGVSDQAAAVALAAHDKGQYLEIYRAFFAEEALNAASIERIAAQHDVAAGEPSAEIKRHLLDTHTLSQALHVSGTPAFFIGDTMIAGADMDALKAAIAAERKKIG